MSDHIFHLVADPAEAAATAQKEFEAIATELRPLLPPQTEILHVGATSVPGCIGKGDLDILVRVRSEDFDAAELALAAVCARNKGSVQTRDFAAFEHPCTNLPVGIQLAARGGAFDFFHCFSDALRCEPELVALYNALKSRFAGQDMESYRRAKDSFVRKVLRQTGLVKTSCDK